MTAQEAVNLVYLKATGKTASFNFTDAKGVKILALLNLYTARWSRTTGVDWNSLYNPLYSNGLITATDTFTINTSIIRKLSQQEGDNVRIVWPAPNTSYYTDYETVPADRLKEYHQGLYCARQGAKIVFNRPFTTTDPQYNGTLYLPVYLYPATLVNASDTIQVDDPMWLVLQCAAEYVRTDFTRLGNYPLIQAEANDCLARMIDDNNNDQNTTVTDLWNPSPWNPSGTQWW